MPAPLKSLVHDAKAYANLMTKLEGGKSSVKVGDMRQTIKLMTNLETALILAQYKSAILIIRRAAQAQAAKIRTKRGSNFVKSIDLSSLAAFVVKTNRKPRKKVVARKKKK